MTVTAITAMMTDCRRSSPSDRAPHLGVVMVFHRRSPEERERQRAQAEAAFAKLEEERAEAEFQRSPVGRARRSRERQDAIFQVTLNLDARSSDEVCEILNKIIREGWQLHSFSTAHEITRINAGHQMYLANGCLRGTYVFVPR